ncbi:MAG: hypothetical protein Q9168_003413 [Polycauliona sp. 1 TL-2023]
MDLLQQLEEFANHAIIADQEPTQEEISRWCCLFDYSASEATNIIKIFRVDVNPRRLTNGQWDLIKAEKKAEGHDRETYEHYLQLQVLSATSIRPECADRDDDDIDNWIFKLGEAEGPFIDIETLQRLVGISAKLEKGRGEEGEADFAVVDSSAKRATEAWLLDSSSVWRPTFVRLTKARKDLSASSMYPTLGVASCLPQYRANNSDQVFRPAQDEYPVWYFFYGTLQDPEILRQCLEISDLPEMTPASVRGGILRSWDGKYKALVDGPDSARVDGYAYQVESPEHEDLLRFRETENYEVVRCRIDLDGKIGVLGLTFRFARPRILRV